VTTEISCDWTMIRSSLFRMLHCRPSAVLRRIDPSHHRGFATRRRNFRRPSHQQSKDYWDKEYERTKQQALSGRKVVPEEREMSEILNWKILLVMAVAPLLVCLVIPELRVKMLASFHLQQQQEEEAAAKGQGNTTP
jgi:hypothetical protein